MKEIKQLTFEKACKLEGLDAKKIVAASIQLAALFPKKDRKSQIAQSKVVIMVKAANRLANDGKPWKPDYNNTDWKYEPRFIVASSGFQCVGYGAWRADSLVGSRLCFKNYDVMKWMCEDNKNYLKVCKEYML
ncbi:MAG: hypothetical protein AAB638_00805 [Patescibacteria group bacterium]